MHNLKMYVGLFVLASIGALQAIHGSLDSGAWVDPAIAILLVIEHYISGNKIV